MQRIIALRAGQPIRRDGIRHVARLHGEHHVVKAAVFQHFRVRQRAFHHALRGRPAVFGEDILLYRAGVHADAHRDMMRLDAVRQNTHVLFAADVAGVDAQLMDAVFHRLDGELVIKMDVGDQRNGAGVHQRAHRVGAGMCLR